MNTSHYKNIDDQRLKGLVALYYYDDQTAQRIFKELLDHTPGSVSALWGIAELHRRAHRYEACRSTIDKLLAIEPAFSPAYVTLGFNAFVQAQFDDAITYAHQALAIKKPRIEHARASAHILLAACNGIRATNASYFSKIVLGPQIMHHINKAQSLMPDTAEVLFGAGVCYLLAPKIFFGDDAKAERHLQRSIALRPLFPDGHVRMSQLLMRKGETNKADELLKKARALDPENELLLDFITKTNRFITD